MNNHSCTNMCLRHVLGLLLLILPSALFGQTQRTVRGLVTNDKGEQLIGVNIRVKGTSSGTVTGTNGQYQLTVSGNDAILVFSFVGFAEAETPVGERSTINMQLKSSARNLDDIVVVGYGTQKKVNLTGAVDQVGGEVFENRPLTNVTRGLQGVIPNLNIRMTDGKPTRGAEYNVRGTTSIGAGGSALILIDGVPGDPNLVNPNDIASVTVLKDAAAAAIYGARGTFGVILITTKSPAKDKTVVNYSGNFSLNERTIKPKMVTNGYQWAKTFDDAFASWNDYTSHAQKVNSVFPFSLDYLDELKRRNDDPSLPKTDINPATGDYVYYGNTDWLKELYADNNPSMEHNLSVSGSSKNVGYYLSGRYMSQQGIFRYNPDNFKTYNLRARGSVQAFPWLKIENDLSFTQSNYFYPILNHPGNTPVWRRISDEAFPIAMLRNPDGTLTENASIVFGSFISGNNQSELSRMQIRNTSRFTAGLFKNRIHLNGDFTFWRLNDVEKRIYTPVPYSKKPGAMLERGESKLNEDDDKTNYLAANLYADYEQTIGKHYFKGMVGYNYENSKLTSRYIQRDGIINNELPDFSLTNGLNFTLRGGGNEWRTIGGFFRLNYVFDERYLLEVNGRYDGTSKFPQHQQWGFFPSASAGWRVSKEKFWTLPYKVFSDLKLRASYGTLGNGNVNPYQFLESMGVSQAARIINGIRPDYTQHPNVIPAGLTWEKATTLNLGADMVFLDDRLTTTFDWYTRKTKDMFTEGLPLPGVFGASEPKGNYADLDTKGWELSIGWRNKPQGRNAFSYDLRFVLSDNQSTITRYNNPLGLINTYYAGMKVGDIWGFVTEGYYKDQHEIDTRGIDQSFVRVSALNKPLPGDIKFADLNGDGKIDEGAGSLSNPGDRRVIGNTSPRYTYGFNSNMEWKGLFLSLFLQGVGKRDFWPGTDNSLIWGPYNRPYSWQPEDVISNMWSEQNPDAYFPRLRGYTALNSRAELTVPQTKYLQNVAYIRLKNLSLGYNLPARLISRAGMSNMRIYLSGQNLWVWSPMYKHIKTMDPEVIEGADPELASGAGNGMSYPMLKTYTFGINVTFK
ncbi:TonB-dependent receptor [uncultured Chitinophaga sp.]|jgi:TonB-linked outer membrane protein, SusC/RagA family|uniref:SusC/RagA family TonB-linked outer membrane protein n=1 Tax=uncultured Chitinophaga sp. TaxID=339340 RepID=UPI00261514F9|nr:TonB-dependent receptor [uncultured Chitinophaga sp.]